ASGKEVGAARGLARSLLALLGERDVTHVAIAFDHVIESFRNDLYPGYKTGDGIEPELHAQFDLAEDACRALGVVTWPMVEFECDDALATAAARFAASTDVERVVVEKFGVHPKSIPDWLALVGDTADGYPGVPRWGAKSAAAVLGTYEKLEAIPADV